MKKCIECKTTENLLPIFKSGTNNGTEENYTKNMICENCLNGNLEYSRCELCIYDAAYHARDLKEGHCKEHYEEITPYDEEDEEDQESLREYYLDPSHNID